MIFRILGFVFVFLLHHSCLYSQHTIYLIGDAGEDEKPGKALRCLQKHIETDSNSTVVFLGDNSYPRGVESDRINVNVKAPYLFPEAARLYSQLQILRKYKGNVFFVPGNHDWRAQRINRAWESVKDEFIIAETYFNDSTRIKNVNEQSYITNIPNVKLEPTCKDVSDNVSIIFFDSQYFLQRIVGISRKEKIKQWDLFLSKIDSMVTVKESAGRKVIIASHHPVFTNGSHSRFRQPLRFLFNWTPFYILGKIGINRWLSQDIEQPLYKIIRQKYLSMLEKHTGVFVVAGHDHNLQYISETDDYHIVSGAGSKLKKLRKRKRFKYEFANDKKEGFVKLLFDEKGGVFLEFVSEDDQVLFSRKLI